MNFAAYKLRLEVGQLAKDLDALKKTYSEAATEELAGRIAQMQEELRVKEEMLTTLEAIELNRVPGQGG